MSLINLFTKKTPTFKVGSDVISFEAILEDTLEASVEYTSFPLEVGTNATDHGIIQPIEWTITGLASNNPLGFSAAQATGLVSNYFDSGIVSSIAGLSAGFLAGSSEGKAGATLQMLMGLMFAREPFDIDAVDIQLTNMVITNIKRTKNASNEGGLEFVAELIELPLISTLISSNQPSQSKLLMGDPSQTQATSLVSKGEIAGQAASLFAISKVSGLL